MFSEWVFTGKKLVPVCIRMNNLRSAHRDSFTFFSFIRIALMEWVSSFVLCWGLFLTESYSFEHTWSHTRRTYFLRSGSTSGASSPFLKHIPTPHQLSQELLVWLAHWLANGFSIIKTISTHIPEHALGRGLSLLPCNWDIKLFIIRLHTTSLPRSTHILWGSLHVRDHSTTGLWPGTLSFP